MRRLLLRSTGHTHLPLSMTNQSPAPYKDAVKLTITLNPSVHRPIDSLLTAQ